jgi:hypothetical protein
MDFNYNHLDILAYRHLSYSLEPLLLTNSFLQAQFTTFYLKEFLGKYNQVLLKFLLALFQISFPRIYQFI